MNETGTIIIAISLMIIMFGMGLSLTKNDFKRIAQNPKAVVLGLLNQLIFLPVIGYILVSILDLRPEISIGIMILAACPGGATSNVIAHLAKGDTALSVTLTAVSSVITIVTIPFIVQFALLEFLGESEKVVLNVPQMIGQLLVIVIIPVFIGMLIRAKATQFALRMGKPVRIASVALLVFITTALFVKESHNIIPYFKQAGLPTILLNFTSMILGYTTAYLLKLKKPQAISIAVESGVQNSALAITIAVVTLQNTAFGIAGAIYTLVMYVAGFAIILFGRK
ncbi:bile acid:sodium symporter family protein [Aquimarina mytili]|uniref:Bile acid:sodium symporter family protein n=1 Tax=Aquimarina mytili TaxID=874423 RepID=A0A937D483_9FLAO|nr:bile acid:sodium symporter family protein [Aquimarina mytili]MBL0681909.1 bile acid:sodium symporter family protein [Aquimarina mytili]